MVRTERGDSRWAWITRPSGFGVFGIVVLFIAVAVQAAMLLRLILGWL